MTEKRLLISLFFLFALSAVYLFSVNERGLDPNQGKDWWSLAFAEPEKSDSLVFSISNHTADPVFHYTIIRENAVLAEGELSISPGQSATHDPSLPGSESGRITITVSHAGRQEVIYRNL